MIVPITFLKVIIRV